MKVKKTDLPVMPPEDILPSLDDEADESDMDDGKIIKKSFYAFFDICFELILFHGAKCKQQT